MRDRIKINYKSIIPLLLLVICLGCNTHKQNRRYKKEYYNSGNLKREGWFIHDSIPVDTIFNYYENGHVELVEIRDDSGYYNGEMKYYYENGQAKEITIYKKNLQQGFSMTFYKNGNLKSKCFWNSGIALGDQYFYDSISGNVSLYNFRNYQGTLSLIYYDPVAIRIVKDIRPWILIDTIRKVPSDNPEYNVFKILLFISNPPHCLTGVNLKFVSKNGIIIDSESLVNIPYYFESKILSDSINNIIFSTIQYDSLIRENIYQEDTTHLDDIRLGNVNM